MSAETLSPEAARAIIEQAKIVQAMGGRPSGRRLALAAQVLLGEEEAKANAGRAAEEKRQAKTSRAFRKSLLSGDSLQSAIQNFCDSLYYPCDRFRPPQYCEYNCLDAIKGTIRNGVCDDARVKGRDGTKTFYGFLPN